MKNPAIFYAAIVIGVVALAVGIYYQLGLGGVHPARALAGLAVGAVLLIVGVVGMFMTRSRATAR
jgi:hypothetical protein